MYQSPIQISLEFTPNPNTLKYALNRKLLERGAIQWTRSSVAREQSPLAARLFDIPGIMGVMFGTDFVTITKADQGDWDVVHQGCMSALKSHFEADLPVLHDGAGSEKAARPASEIENKIQEVLDREIRPAVAMDGGDIALDRFENGVVYVHLQGSCSGCPSATMTLKSGVEHRLRALIPEVKEVVAV